jgi:hypothetical protein
MQLAIATSTLQASSGRCTRAHRRVPLQAGACTRTRAQSQTEQTGRGHRAAAGSINKGHQRVMWRAGALRHAGTTQGSINGGASFNNHHVGIMTAAPLSLCIHSDSDSFVTTAHTPHMPASSGGSHGTTAIAHGRCAAVLPP